MRKVCRYKKRKKTRVIPWNPWNFDAEPGDLMVTFETGELRRLVRSNAAGELSYDVIKPPQDGLEAIIENGEVWWVQKPKKGKP